MLCCLLSKANPWKHQRPHHVTNTTTNPFLLLIQAIPHIFVLYGQWNCSFSSCSLSCCSICLLHHARWLLSVPRKVPVETFSRSKLSLKKIHAQHAKTYRSTPIASCKSLKTRNSGMYLPVQESTKRWLVCSSEPALRWNKSKSRAFLKADKTGWQWPK